MWSWFFAFYLIQPKTAMKSLLEHYIILFPISGSLCQIASVWKHIVTMFLLHTMFLQTKALAKWSFCTSMPSHVTCKKNGVHVKFYWGITDVQTKCELRDLNMDIHLTMASNSYVHNYVQYFCKNSCLLVYFFVLGDHWSVVHGVRQHTTTRFPVYWSISLF